MGGREGREGWRDGSSSSLQPSVKVEPLITRLDLLSSRTPLIKALAKLSRSFTIYSLSTSHSLLFFFLFPKASLCHTSPLHYSLLYILCATIPTLSSLSFTLKKDRFLSLQPAGSGLAAGLGWVITDLPAAPSASTTHHHHHRNGPHALQRVEAARMRHTLVPLLTPKRVFSTKLTHANVQNVSTLKFLIHHDSHETETLMLSLTTPPELSRVIDAGM